MGSLMLAISAVPGQSEKPGWGLLGLMGVLFVVVIQKLT